MKVAIVSSLLVLLGLAPLAFVSAGYWQQQVGPTSDPKIPIQGVATPSSPLVPSSTGIQSFNTTPTLPPQGSFPEPSSRPIASTQAQPALTPSSTSPAQVAPLSPPAISTQAPSINTTQAPMALPSLPSAPGLTTAPAGPQFPGSGSADPFGSAPYAPRSSNSTTAEMTTQGSYGLPGQMQQYPGGYPGTYGLTPALLPPTTGQQQQYQPVIGFDMEDQRLSADTQGLALQLRQAEGDQRKNLETELRDLVTKQFEHRQELKRQEIAALEARLAEITQRVEARESNKDQIIEQRIRELTGDDPFRWDDAQNNASQTTPGFPVPMVPNWGAASVAPAALNYIPGAAAPGVANATTYQDSLAVQPPLLFDSTGENAAVWSYRRMESVYYIPAEREVGRELSSEEQTAVELLKSEWDFVEGELPSDLLSSYNLVCELLIENARYSEEECTRLIAMIDRGLVPTSKTPIKGTALKELLDGYSAFGARFETLGEPIAMKIERIRQDLAVLQNVGRASPQETDELQPAVNQLLEELAEAQSQVAALRKLLGDGGAAPVFQSTDEAATR